MDIVVGIIQFAIAYGLWRLGRTRSEQPARAVLSGVCGALAVLFVCTGVLTILWNWVGPPVMKFWISA